MATPACEKTWSHTQVIVPAHPTEATQLQTLMLAIKNLLVSMGWTVLQSSKPTTTSWDASDLWSVSTDLTYSGAGAYIILQTPAGMTVPWYLYIGMSSSTYYQATIQFSKVLYPPGAWNAPPSSTGAVTLLSNTYCWNGMTNCTNTQFILHGLVSSDGKHSRIIGLSKNTPMFLIFGEEMADTQGAYNPGVVGWSGMSTTLGDNLKLIQLYSLTGRMTCSADTALETNTCAAASFTGETFHSYSNYQLCGMGAAADYVDGCWPMGAIGVFSASANHFGKRGRMKDLYWGCSINLIGTTFPDSAGGARGWIKIGDLVFPACGDLWSIS